MSKRCETRLVTFGPETSRRREGELEIVTLRASGTWKGNEVNPLTWHLLAPFRRTDVVHVHQWESTVSNAAIVMGRLLGKRVFVTDHGGGGINYWRQLHLDHAIHGFLAQSQYAADQYPTLTRKTTLIGGGVDTRRFRPGGTQRERRAVFVGRLLKHKGLENLLSAVTDRTPLLVIGRPYDTKFRQALGRLATDKPVEFREDVDDDDLVTAYQTSRVAVLPSVYQSADGSLHRKPELLGLTLYEAMACATPVICTDVGGMPEVVQDGLTGFVVRPGDTEQLGAKLEHLLHDDVAWRACSAQALHYGQANSWDALADRCLRAYGDTAGPR
jgi:glycosyltransferase involved in cell wall biosynthesis